MAAPKRNHGDPPGDPRARGEVTFNYRSHDGRFLLGSEPWLFETRWSSAGSRAAHLYNDPPSIRGIAIAEGVSAIGEVSADIIARSDFSSRTRTPNVGQCAILENQNGLFAVLQILSVDHSDLPSKNIMRFRYAIQTDESVNFVGHDVGLDTEISATLALLQAAEEARLALAAVRTLDTETVEIPFGHNGPPLEHALTEADRQDAIAAVEIVATVVVQTSPDRDRLRVAANTIARVALTVGLWIAAKTNEASEEFAKTMGKASAVAVVGTFAAWVAMHGKLTLLAHLLSSFTG